MPASLAGYRGLKADLLIALKKGAQPMTATELAERFGLTPNGLRRHLKALEEAEVVRYRREARGVGGPVYAYTLTASGEALFPNAYSEALVAALETLGAERGADAVVALFRKQWESLVAEAAPTFGELPLAERAQLLAELRSSQGYMAEAEAGEEEGAVIREHNCAIRAAAHRFPEICAAELGFFAETLGADVERRSHILSGCNECEYVVRPRVAGAAESNECEQPTSSGQPLATLQEPEVP
jgi:DeoR family suf operon transcriptional repressor